MSNVREIREGIAPADHAQRYLRLPDGSYDLPSMEQVVRDLYRQQGDLLAFLTAHAGVSQVEQRRLLFEILFALKAEPILAEQWDKLLTIYTRQQTQLAEAMLLRVVDVEMAQTKPEKVLSVLERLSPEKWAKRSITGGAGKKARTNPYEQLMQE